ncbi:MAG: DUF1559 domain-containing protein [Planctomyces sp.]|nr:DUF1559 domain-containing protein [Planctomyces sp.]
MASGACLMLVAAVVGVEHDVNHNDNRCGARALAVCAATCGVTSSIFELDLRAGSKGAQTSLLDLTRAAEATGLHTLAIEWNPRLDVSTQWTCSGILRVLSKRGEGHFVAVHACDRGRMLILDFPRQLEWVEAAVLRDRWQWDGTILHIASTPNDLAGLDVKRQGMASLLFGVASFLIGGCFIWIATHCSESRAAWSRAKVSQLAFRQLRLMDRKSLKAGRRGLTLLETLVTMGIISLLLSLIVPAVQSARESARRAACLNNLRQIGVACAAFESSERKYPSGGTLAVDSSGKQLSLNLSPHVQLLPYLDQSAIHSQFNMLETGDGEGADPPVSKWNQTLISTTIPIFQCPSDNFPAPRSNYRVSCGTSPGWHGTKDRGPNSARPGFRSLYGQRDSAFVDGKSQTAAFCERVTGDRERDWLTPSRDAAIVNGVMIIRPDDAVDACRTPLDPTRTHYSFLGYTWALSGYHHTWYNHVLPPNSSTPDCNVGNGAVTARSLHPGGVNILMADGSARFANSNVALEVWRAIGSIDGQEFEASEF